MAPTVTAKATGSEVVLAWPCNQPDAPALISLALPIPLSKPHSLPTRLTTSLPPAQPLTSDRQQLSWREGKSAMSDADTEGSAGTAGLWRHASLTSSESDGPRIVVHTTSEDEDQDEITLEAVSLLRLAPPESVTTTDIGSDCNSEGAESGHEVDSAEVSSELAAALAAQVEEYLSDNGLAKDLFLLKHIKRHRDGFVSLKLLSGYKKVKKLSRDWRVLSSALRTSQKLQLNEVGTKVRRRDPLPANLMYDVPTSRSLVAVNIPAAQANMAALVALFSNYGAVASLQVVRPRPGGGVPPALQRLAARMPELTTTTCAVVEYEDVWGAASALHHLASSTITLHVLRRSRRPSTSSRTSPTPTPTPRGRGWYDNGVPAEELRQRLKGTWTRLRQDQAESSGSEGDDGSAGLSWRRSPNQLTPQPLARPSFHHHHHHHHHHHFHRSGRGSTSTPTSPAIHRRHDPPGVTRSPRGPDGTRGFSRVRS